MQLKSLFNTFNFGPRLIDIHGRPKPRHGLIDHAMTPDILVGLGITLGATVLQASTLIGDTTVADVALKGLGATALGAAFAAAAVWWKVNDLNKMPRHNIEDCAIDTEGKATRHAKCTDIENQARSLRRFSTVMTGAFAGGLALYNLPDIHNAWATAMHFRIPEGDKLASMAIMGTATARMLAVRSRASKIIKGHYTPTDMTLAPKTRNRRNAKLMRMG